MGEALLQTCYQVLFASDAVMFGSVFWPREPSYDELAALIRPYLNGEGFTPLVVIIDGEANDMFVSALSGARLGAMPCQAFNRLASHIWRQSQPRPAPLGEAERALQIYGAAVLFKRRVWRVRASDSASDGSNRG